MNTFQIVLAKKKKKKKNRIKLNWKRLYETILVNFLDINTDNRLKWKIYMGDIATEIIVANAMHYKVRDYVNTEILNSMYHAQFES